MNLLNLAIGVLWAPPILVFVGCPIFVIYNTTRRNFDHVRRYLEWLLRRGYDKAFVKFTHKRSGNFIRFEKYLRLDGYGIALVVPGDWPQDDVAQLRNWCGANGLTLEPDDPGTGEQTSNLKVDYARNLDSAYALAREIWFGIFGLTRRSRYQYEGQDILPLDELIDTPDYPRLAESEIRQRRDEESRHQLADSNRRFRLMGASGYGYGCLIGITGLIFAVSMVGLSIATLVSVGDPPDWTLAIGTVTASGSTTSVAFLVLYLFAYSIGALIRRADNQKSIQNERLFWSIVHVTVLAQPLAAFAVWIGA